MPLEPDETQARVLEHGAGPLLVTGPPGSGKTAVLRERFARLIEAGTDPERVTLVVGSAHSRNDARAALLERLRVPLPVLRVTTVHGLAYQVVNARFRDLGYAEPPRVLSASDQFTRVRELLAGEDPSQWPAYGSMLGLRGFADEVRQFMLRAQEALLDPDDIHAKANDAGLSGWRELADFYRQYLRVLDGEGAIDFAGLVEQAAAAAKRGGSLFDHVLVDDFHDTTFGAESMLFGLQPGSLVVAGDPDAHVFSFQGTTVEPLRRFTGRFPGAREMRLQEDYRGSGVPFAAWHAPHTSEEHAAVARELRRIHVEERVPWNHLAVVVRRQGSRLGNLIRALDDARVPRVVPEGGLSLLIEPAVVPYVLALRWLARRRERDDLIEHVLTSDLAELSPAEARGLVRTARAAGEPAADALNHAAGLGPGQTEALVRLRAALDRAEPLAARSVLDAFSVLWRELPCSSRLVEAAETSREAERDLDAVLALAEAVARAGESSDPSVESFLDELEAGEEGPGHAAPRERGGGAVQVLTAHGTVGREFAAVLLVGAVEGNFPSLSRPEPMFDLASLERRVSQSERNRLRLEDERRLFRMVTARAARHVVVTASDEHEAGATLTARSRFVSELGVSWGPAPVPPYGDPLTTAEATATWRRTLADPKASPGSRVAALEGLLVIGVDPGRWWFQRDWTDGGSPLHDPVHVSASKLDTLENCELQFVLREELGLESRSGHYAWVGHLVHRIIEDCEAGRIDRQLDALVVAARDRWRPQEFPSRAVSETFLRLVTERMLPAWFEEYGAEPALAAERRFEFEFDGAVVTGVIDRIGRVQGGGSQITDYKTGKRRRASADEVLQLGIYFLAVNRTPDLEEFLPVRGVELAFVRDVDWRGGDIARIAKAFTSQDEPEYRAVMTRRLSELIRRVRDLDASGVYRPNPAANCRYCQFKPLCPLFPEGAELFPRIEGAGT